MAENEIKRELNEAEIESVTGGVVVPPFPDKIEKDEKVKAKDDDFGPQAHRPLSYRPI